MYLAQLMQAVDPTAGEWPEAVAAELRTVAAACLQSAREVCRPWI